MSSRARERFIPAHAGNARGLSDTVRPPPVHPRARGERPAVPPYGTTHGGSSPRTRGTRLRPVAHRDDRRFIPAHAGNARQDSSSGASVAVHPRARGERSPGGPCRPPSPGSSPRTRGTRDVHLRAHAVVRFIPAHAGNAAAARRSSRARTVHPRARGERSSKVRSQSCTSGSSPRTRGTPGGPRSSRVRERFIPAHAGNASPTSTPRA